MPSDGEPSLASPSYVLTTPVRDERAVLPGLLAALEAQQSQPARWVVVDDGSRDGSGEWLGEQARSRPWITVTSGPEAGSEYLGAHVARLKRAGLEKALELEPGAGFAGVLDADIRVPPEHYRVLLDAFAADPGLGVASSIIHSPAGRGLAAESFQRDDLPRGGTQFFRAACLEQIGGLPPWPGFDGAANVLARLRGWRCRLLDDLVAEQVRPTATRFGAAAGYARKGRYAWFLGLHPGLVAVRALAYSLRPPRAAGVHFARGWLGEAIRRAPRCPDAGVLDYYRRERPREYLMALVGRGGATFAGQRR